MKVTLDLWKSSYKNITYSYVMYQKSKPKRKTNFTYAISETIVVLYLRMCSQCNDIHVQTGHYIQLRVLWVDINWAKIIIQPLKSFQRGTSSVDENRNIKSQKRRKIGGRRKKSNLKFEICDDIIVDVAVFQQPGLNS